MDEPSKKTILLVEDEAIIGMAQARSIERFGYGVINALSGEKAVELALADDRVDLVLMDIDLGKGIDGTEAARRILAERNKPIVFLTSHSERDMVRKVRGITRYGYVIKNSGDFVLQSSIEMAFELFDAHERTKSQETELAAIYENAPIIMMLLDADRRILKANNNAAQFAGRARDEIIGLKCGAAMSCRNAFASPDDCGSMPGCESCVVMRTAQETLDTGRSRDGVAADLSIDREGTRHDYHFLLSTKVLKVAETPLVLVSLMDITERKKAENALILSERRNSVLNRIANVFLTVPGERAYAEAAGVVVRESGGAIGVFGHVGAAGDAATPCRILGAGTGPEFAERSIGVSPSILEMDLWKDLLAEKKARTIEGPIPMPAGHPPLKRLVFAPILLGDEPIGFVAAANGEGPYTGDDARMLEDIAHYVSPILNARRREDWQERERERAEEELVQLNSELEARVRDRTVELERKNAQLQELDRLKSLFIASMSRELRTPLNSIIGFSGILGDEWAGRINPEQRENLSIIQRSGKLLLTMVNNVIDVSEMEAGAIEARYGEFELSEVLEEAARYLEDEIRKKALTLRLEIHSRSLYTDKRRLLQCVLNLLSNAVKFTDKGEIRLASQSAPTGSPMPMVEISVGDTGYGIAAMEMSRLYKPFSRLDSSIKARSAGTGLGLYLSKRLAIEILRGDIRCDSAVGAGSTFTLRIPERIDAESPGGRGQRG